jgi:hypothetical protein
MERRFEKGTVVSAVGHAGLILWVLVGDWLFAANAAPEPIVMDVSTVTSDQFDELVAATQTPAEEPAPVRPQARPEDVVEPPPEEPPPVEEPIDEPPPPVEEPPPPVEEPPEEIAPEPVVEPPPSEAPQAEVEQALDSESTELQPVAEAEEIVAPDPVQPETEAESSDLPEPAVAEDPAAEEIIQDEPTEETVAEDTGDILETEANELQEAETGMTASIRPRSRPERAPERAPEPEPEVEVASAEVPEETPEAPAEETPEEPVEQPVDDQNTDAAIDALLGEIADESAEDPAEAGGQDLPVGPPLSGSEMGNISSAIARRWNVGTASTDALRTMVVVRVTFAPDGKPLNFELIESNGPSQTAIDVIFQTARSAVSRAYAQDGGLPLPPEKYDTWRVLDLVFDANGMALR